MQVAKPTQPTLLSRLEHIGTTKGTYSLYSLRSYESCWFPRSFRLQNPINFPSHVRPAQGHVQQISSTFEAFAALRSDGQVICWGDPFFGGNGTERLENVQSVEGSQTAFAAVRKDGTVTAWGVLVNQLRCWSRRLIAQTSNVPLKGEVSNIQALL